MRSLVILTIGLLLIAGAAIGLVLAQNPLLQHDMQLIVEGENGEDGGAPSLKIVNDPPRSLTLPVENFHGEIAIDVANTGDRDFTGFWTSEVCLEGDFPEAPNPDCVNPGMETFFNGRPGYERNEMVFPAGETQRTTVNFVSKLVSARPGTYNVTLTLHQVE